MNTEREKIIQKGERRSKKVSVERLDPKSLQCGATNSSPLSALDVQQQP